MKLSFFTLMLSIMSLSYGQNLKPFYDSTYHMHILLPQSWETSQTHDESLLPKGSEMIFHSTKHAKNYHTESLNSTVIHYNSDSNSIRSRTFQRQNGDEPNEHISWYAFGVRYPAFHPEPKIYFESDFKKLICRNPIGHVALARMEFTIRHNKDFYYVVFTAPKRKFEKYKPLFLKIANSVYFD